MTLTYTRTPLREMERAFRESTLISFGVVPWNLTIKFRIEHDFIFKGEPHRLARTHIHGARNSYNNLKGIIYWFSWFFFGFVLIFIYLNAKINCIYCIRFYPLSHTLAHEPKAFGESHKLWHYGVWENRVHWKLCACLKIVCVCVFSLEKLENVVYALECPVRTVFHGCPFETGEEMKKQEKSETWKSRCIKFPEEKRQKFSTLLFWIKANGRRQINEPTRQTGLERLPLVVLCECSRVKTTGQKH